MTVFVIGGANTDISGMPVNPLLLRDSNIAHITLRAGGVGRNIAVRLREMGLATELVAAFGEDPFGAALLEDCRTRGVGTSLSVRIPGGRSGVYLCVNDEAGDMYVAMNDMDICAALTPALVDMARVNAGDACVLDANLPAQTLLHVAERAKIPLFCDPVSVAKCARVQAILPYLYAIKPNLMEARALTGASTPAQTATALVDMGVREAYVSLGGDGVCYADRQGCGFAPAVQTDILDTTGAGDAAMAAICAGRLGGMDMAHTAAFACEKAADAIHKKSEEKK